MLGIWTGDKLCRNLLIPIYFSSKQTISFDRGWAARLYLSFNFSIMMAVSQICVMQECAAHNILHEAWPQLTSEPDFCIPSTGCHLPFHLCIAGPSSAGLHSWSIIK